MYIAYNVLSRLKGIETKNVIDNRDTRFNLQCPFPFEGNRNLEGGFMSKVVDIYSYNVLSRLKGIETSYFPQITTARLLLTMSFPV